MNMTPTSTSLTCFAGWTGRNVVLAHRSLVSQSVFDFTFLVFERADWVALSEVHLWSKSKMINRYAFWKAYESTYISIEDKSHWVDLRSKNMYHAVLVWKEALCSKAFILYNENGCMADTRIARNVEGRTILRITYFLNDICCMLI